MPIFKCCLNFNHMQNIILNHTVFAKNQIHGHVTIKGVNEVIGTYEFYTKKDNLLASINIYSDFRKKGIGFFIFHSCFKVLNNENNLQHFIASWSQDNEYLHLPNQQSTNLTVFLNSLEKGLTEDLALWSTPTGKWLKKIGFTKAQVLQISPESVDALFSK